MPTARPVVPRRRPCCSARRSSSQSARKPATSNRNVALGANTWRSPVQPRRSSRCGQSVGTSTKLPRIPQTTFSCSRSSSSFEHVNVPVRSKSEWITTAVKSRGSTSASGQPSTSTYRKPWNVKVGSHVSGPSPRQGVPIRRLRVPQRPRAELAVFQHLGVTERDDRAGRAFHREPDPADEVLAEVEHGAPRRRDDHLADGQLLCPPHWWSGASDEPAHRRREGLGGAPCRVVEPGGWTSRP